MIKNVQYVAIQENEAGQRVDNYLIRQLKGVPKSHIYRIIRQGEVRVNKKRVQVHTKLIEGDILRIPPVRVSEEKNILPSKRLEETLQSSILYEDEAILVINKPAGLAVHGGSGVSLGVIEALRQMRANLQDLALVHRLDKETSGCLVLAKKRSALRAIQAQLEARTVQKCYWALVLNAWQGPLIQEIDAPLLKNILQSGERMVTVNSAGKSSLTTFKLLENYAHYCWVEASPKTGRTHQIRVHAAYFHHPIIGDHKYLKNTDLAPEKWHKARLYLHARSIQFKLNDRPLLFEAPLDEQFNHVLQKLRKEKLS